MKRMKRVLALALAMIMVMAMGITASAADDYTLTVNNTVSGHTYTAYQIFKGSKADKGQVSYGELAADATYDEDTTYYYKKGADYYVETSIEDAESFGAAKTARGKLYTRNGSSALGDTVWGSDITTAGKKALYTEYGMTVADDKLDDQANIQALLEKIADADNTAASESDKAVRFANVFYTTDNDGNVTAKTGLLTGGTAKTPAEGATSVTYSDLASGYYLVNDSYTPEEGEVNGVDYSIARIAVQVVGNTTINNKADKPSGEKKIKTAGELLNEKANELGIGRVVEFEVTEAVPNYDGYNYYYFVMRDKMSDGLTFNPDSVQVKVGNDVITKLTPPEKSTDGKGYYLYADEEDDESVLTANDNSSTFAIAFENIMNFPVGQPIVVTYTANVNSDAVTGIDPNNNEVKVDYSNNPTKSEEHNVDEDHPGVPAYTTDTPVGTTPRTFTDTYTTKLTIHKKDNSGNALANVEFTLTGTAKDVVLNTEEVFELDPDGEYYMLKDGTYTKTAPTSVATITETTGNSGWVEIGSDETYTGSDVRVVDGKKLRPFVIATDQGKTHYVIVEGNAASYASTSLRYSISKKTSDAAETYNVAMVGKTDASGNLDFSQLGAGTYKLSETEVLPGYNDVQDITFTISCTLPDADAVVAGTEKATWTVSGITPEGTAITQVMAGEEGNQTGTGVFEVTIVNNKGTELPSTGGIGTTMFYVVGTILVIGAGVLLVSRKRMNMR